MLVVIFKATIADFDDEYACTVVRLKELAFNKYGCQNFVSVTQGDQEIAISYWQSMQQIRDWKNDPEHKHAQNMGRDKWYKSFNVEICEVVDTR
jgi:heme-degrading monooxygenase HmoA